MIFVQNIFLIVREKYINYYITYNITKYYYLIFYTLEFLATHDLKIIALIISYVPQLPSMPYHRQTIS